MLKRKTVLLVTHGMQFLKQCDRVIFLKNGSIEEEGTHKELMEQKVGLEDVRLTTRTASTPAWPCLMSRGTGQMSRSPTETGWVR